MFSTLFPENLPSTWRLGFLLTLLMALSTAFCITVAGWAVRQDLNLIARAVVLDDLGEYAVLYRRHGIAELAAAFAGGEHGGNQAVRVMSRDGRVLFEKIPPEMAGYRWPVVPPGTGTEASPGLLSIAQESGDQQLLAGFQLLNDGNVLWFGRTDAEDRAYLSHVRGRLWLAGLASLVLLLLPLWWFVRTVMRPVRDMGRSISRLAEGSTGARLAASGAVPELQAFAAAFNTGLDRIDALTGELQSANDMLAHELRTPLARIRGNLENFHDATDNPPARDAAARGMEEIDRAADLVHTILTTRAGEHRALRLHLETVELGELLGTLHELYRAAADERGLDFALDTLEVSPLDMVAIDRQRISQAVANLLDNALAYTPRGGRIILTGSVRSGLATIAVIDTGPGPNAADLDIIWNRYVRGSAASASTPGLGLGLALVRAIAHAHGGQAGCRNVDGGGAEFWIEFPAAGPAEAATTTKLVSKDGFEPSRI